MKRIIFFLLVIMFSLAPYAQKTVHKKPVKKTAVANRKHQAQRKPAARRAKAPTKAERRAATYSNASIRGLQGQRADIQRRIREQEQALRKNKADVKKRLEDLMTLNGEIDQSQKKIEGIEKDIHHINGNIGILQAQLKTLQQQLQDRKNKYIRSMRYMSRHHTVQDKLMFIFSAKNLTQMYRRLSFIRQYSSYQKVQGEAVKAKQQQVNDKHKQLQNVKGHKNTLLYKGKQEKTVLEGKQTQQQEMVHGLQKQQKTIQAVIADQRQKDAAINAQIDRLIQQEVAKARARAAAEAKRKAAAAAAAKKRAEELARKKAAAEAAARENARRIAEAKADEERQVREIAAAKKEAQEASTLSSVDRMLSGGFEANRGRLPMPISGGYRIVSHFGQYNVQGLKGVRLDNKGINIQGKPGCVARSIYDGEVSAVFGYGGMWNVLVRHGAYISVYCNLKSVSVHKGQKVSTRQALGSVGSDNILQFQLCKETAKLNPEAWLGR